MCYHWQLASHLHSVDKYFSFIYYHLFMCLSLLLGVFHTSTVYLVGVKYPSDLISGSSTKSVHNIAYTHCNARTLQLIQCNKICTPVVKLHSQVRWKSWSISVWSLVLEEEVQRVLLSSGGSNVNLIKLMTASDYQHFKEKEIKIKGGKQQEECCCSIVVTAALVVVVIVFILPQFWVWVGFCPTHSFRGPSLYNTVQHQVTTNSIK